MFLFNRKKFLVDSISGMVDIHNHVLPGIDDGAKNVVDSIDMIKRFQNLGISRMVCTPHIKNDQFPNTPETIIRAYHQLMDELLLNEDINMGIEYAAEHMLDDQFEQILLNDKFMPLPGGYLLVETSFRGIPLSFSDSLSQIQNKGYYPILAHPERYFYFEGNTSKLKNIKNQGVFLQVNLLSVIGYYGKDIKKQALKLIEHGLIDFIGTDVHNSSQLDLIKNSSVSLKVSRSIKRLSNNNQEHFLQ